LVHVHHIHQPVHLHHDHQRHYLHHDHQRHYLDLVHQPTHLDLVHQPPHLHHDHQPTHPHHDHHPPHPHPDHPPAHPHPAHPPPHLDLVHQPTHLDLVHQPTHLDHDDQLVHDHHDEHRAHDSHGHGRARWLAGLQPRESHHPGRRHGALGLGLAGAQCREWGERDGRQSVLLAEQHELRQPAVVRYGRNVRSHVHHRRHVPVLLLGALHPGHDRNDHRAVAGTATGRATVHRGSRQTAAEAGSPRNVCRRALRSDARLERSGQLGLPPLVAHA